ncbi:MAG: DNA repair protein RadC [Candidatus Gribaldobacteria bacterium]|nr:DNA repair protein RadC [Candidatus Gribaldobacteria bacterium]
MPKLKDTPKIDRPREKFLAKGPDALSKSELLAILIGSGIKGKNVKQLSEQIIKKYSNTFLDLTIADLLAISGIGKAKALQIISSLALARRFYDEKKPQENLILTAKDAIALNFDLKEKKKEYLVCLFLNARNALLKKEIISIGTLDKSLIHPREIFGPAVELRSAGIILLHNHPSGDPSPSEQDKEVFNKIIEAGKIMGVNILDFIIIGNEKNHSFFECLQGENKQDFYISDGVQFSFFDLLIDKKIEYSNQEALLAKKIKIIDLFAGIGGIKIGFENVGFECVFSNDFDKNCKITYDLNFSGDQKALVLGDIFKISSDIIPDFDILTGGFPCQPFSIAGYQKGFSDDGRGNLFFEIIRILKDKKPKAFLLENVKNLKTHDNSSTIKVIYSELQKLGYYVVDKVLNTMEYGNIPQNRERIYIVGFLDQKAFSNFSFPGKIPLVKTINDCLEKNIDEKYYYNGSPLFARLKKEVVRQNTVYQWRRQYVRENKNNVCPTLTANMGMGGHNVPIIIDNKGIRKLTPRECANFQGFPNNFKLPNIADSALYKQFGNSVSVPVVERVAANIKKALT